VNRSDLLSPRLLLPLLATCMACTSTSRTTDVVDPDTLVGVETDSPVISDSEVGDPRCIVAAPCEQTVAAAGPVRGVFMRFVAASPKSSQLVSFVPPAQLSDDPLTWTWSNRGRVEGWDEEELVAPALPGTYAVAVHGADYPRRRWEAPCTYVVDQDEREPMVCPAPSPELPGFDLSYMFLVHVTPADTDE
jgi:hypothetical protein